MSRSYLFVPGNRPERFAKAAASGADAIILDLEDSVPTDQREAAQAAVSAWQPDPGTRVATWVRSRPLGTDGLERDLEAALAGVPAAGIVLPKCEGAEDVLELGSMLDRLERAGGLTPGSTAIVAIATETARAMQRIHSFDRALPRLSGVMWGAEDLASGLGLRSLRDEDGAWLSPAIAARNAALLAAVACGADPIDTPYTRVSDPAGLVSEMRAHARMGFTAKAAIHPSQVAGIHEGLRPARADIDWARAVIEALEDGRKAAALLDGAMIDVPHLTVARRIVAAAG
ncbi:MAG: CoA ester lyase [Burkholderiaceae bacterium]